jgi:hypothetical protein
VLCQKGGPMPLISADLMLVIVSNAVVVTLAFGRLHTRLAVLQTKLTYLERRLRAAGTLPADLDY